MKYNAITEVDFLDASEAWFVTTADVKRALNMVFDTSGSYEFTDDDTYIYQSIHDARSILEGHLGIFLTRGTATVVVRNECGGIELPGPVQAAIVLTDIDGNTITNAVYSGNHFKSISYPKLDYMKAVYSCGYDIVNQGGAYPTFPQALKRAWVEQCVWMYTHRGDENEFAFCKQAANSSAPYQRKSCLV